MQQDTALFAELFEAQPQAIIWLTPVWNKERSTIIDFQYTYCNQEGLRYLNIHCEQLQNLSISNSPTLTNELRTKMHGELVQVYFTGQTNETTFYNEALNKHARVFQMKMRDGILTVVQDTTDEKRIIRQLEDQSLQLQRQKNLLDNLLKHSPAGISITEMIRDENGTVVDGRTILSNDMAAFFTGLPNEIALTATVRQIDPALFDSPLYLMALDTLRTGKSFSTQYFFEPTRRWLELLVAKMDDDHLINVFMDITATKEAQLKQQKLLEELQRSNTNLEEFAYAASHDLKEPIRKVLFFSDRIKSKSEGRMDTEDQRLFERLENATRRMESLVDDLLAFSQVSQTPRQMETVDLNVVMARVLEDLELEIMEKKAVIHCHSLASVQGFARQLQQLFLNLLGNALKYIKPGATPEIWIECSRIKGQDIGIRLDPSELASQFFCIEVRDNGIGFDSKDAERIFNVFTRLHGNTEFRGTGIGLSIARRVVQNHGGYITAESEPDHGAKFRVFLPC